MDEQNLDPASEQNENQQTVDTTGLRRINLTPNASNVDIVLTQPISKKTLIKIWLILGGLVAAALLTFLVILPLFQIPKADYNEAYKLANSAESALVKIVNPSVFYSHNTEAILKNELDKFNSGYQSYRDELAKLTEDSRAISGDLNAKRLYFRLVSKNQRFDEAAKAIGEAYGQILPKFVDLNTYNDDSASKYVTLLESMTNLEHDVNRVFAANALASARNLYIAVHRHDKIYDYDNLVMARVDFDSKFKDWSANLDRLIREASPQTELDALSQYLAEKSL
jgi:hypothetical protein